MHRSALFSLAALAAWGPLALNGQETRKEGDRWVRTFRGSESVAAGSRLRVNGHGPVKLSSDASDALGYQIDVAVKARSQAEAGRLLRGFAIKVERQGGWITLTAMRGPALATMTVTAPRTLREVVISTSDGAVDVASVECPLRVDSGAGNVKVERAGGDLKLVTGGGEIRVGSVEGSLTAVTGGGPVTVRSVRGAAMLETAGGDVTADSVIGILRASTVGGAVRIGSAGASVTATTGGGPIVIGRAVGIVTARNVAGPVQVGAAGGVRAESGTGAIQLANVSGNMRVSTSIGSIIASLLGGKVADGFLSTGNGDITVLIPSNLGVTIRAENEMADTIQRIVSEFPGIPVRLQGTQVVAEGRINGGGPLLRISGTGGTIFIKRQQ